MIAALIWIVETPLTVEFSFDSLSKCRLHHPDTKASGSEAEKARAIERSKLITSAYQTIKSQMKR